MMKHEGAMGHPNTLLGEALARELEGIMLSSKPHVAKKQTQYYNLSGNVLLAI